MQALNFGVIDDDVCDVVWVEVNLNEGYVKLLRLEVEHYL